MDHQKTVPKTVGGIQTEIEKKDYKNDEKIEKEIEKRDR